MKKLKVLRGLQVLLAGILIACLVLPVGIAYAETPVSVSIVAASAAEDGLGSPFQHHSFTAEGVHWVFYQTAADVIACSWSDDGTTWVAYGSPIHVCDADNVSLPAETVGGQFDLWYHPADETVHFVVVNSSINGSDIVFAKYVVDAVAHTLTIDGSWVTAVAGVANYSYRNPTICVNNDDQDFITWGNVSNGVSDVYVTSTANCAGNPWTPDTGFPMYNISETGEEAMYGSVIPLYADNNISVQYADYNGSVWKISQLNVNYNGSDWIKDTLYDIDTSGWYLPSSFEWDYNAVSIATGINGNDVAIQCSQTDGAEYRTLFNRRGNESDAWGSSGLYARNFGEGGWASLYVGAMGIRDYTYNLVYSGWNMEALSTGVYSNDFSASTGDWDGIASVYTDVNIPLVSTMSEYIYDPAGTADLGFLYGTTTDDNIMYGLYGPAVPATPTDPGTSVMQIIIPLLIAITVVVLALKGIGEVNTVSAIIILLGATIIGIVSFVVIKALVLGI